MNNSNVKPKEITVRCDNNGEKTVVKGLDFKEIRS